MSAVSFRPDIQGLRAIAVLAVIAFHFNPTWLPGGFVGVDVFLVISGFLITSILLEKKAQADYRLGSTLKYFYTSRLKRIAPAYFVMLMVVALLSAILFLPQDFNVFKQGLEKAVWFISNNYFAGFGDYFAPANHEQPLLHTWSLAVEVQFYLLAPFLILLLPPRLLAPVLVLLLVGLTLTAEYRLRLLGIEQSTYYSLYARLPEFFAGALVALYLHTGLRLVGGGWNGSLGLLLVLFATLAQPTLGPFPGLGALLPVLGAALIVLQTTQCRASKVLSHPILVWIGALSYSLYLWHWPVLAYLRYYTGAEVLDWQHSLIFVTLTLLLSMASYYLVEKPLRHSRGQQLRYAVLALTVVGVALSMKNINGHFTPEPLPVEYTRYADPATICHGKIVGDCLRGNLNSEREVLVLGDSHAAMLNHFFDYLGKELDFKARIITASGCVTIPKFDYQRIPEWAHQACLNQIDAVEPFLESAGVIFIAGAWDSQVKHQEFKATLKSFMVQKRDKELYLIPQVPRFKRDVTRTERFLALGLASQLERSHSYQLANIELEEMALSNPSAKIVALDFGSIFTEAPFHQKRLLYRDAHHLNEVGAKVYGEAAKPVFFNIFSDIAP